jgi:hypothetical protein
VRSLPFRGRVSAPWPDPRYRRLTPALLASLSADEVAAAVVQHVQLQLTGRAEWEAEVVGMLPDGTRAIYTTWLVDVSVNEGGFERFFRGPGARYAGQALAGYELLGAEEYATVMRAAIATFEVERPSWLRDSELEGEAGDVQPSAALAEVDQRYYALGDRIYNMWAGVARHRPELFE